MQDDFIKMIVELRPIKPGRTLFAGESKSNRGTTDTKVYDIMRANAVETIVNDTAAAGSLMRKICSSIT